MGLEGKKILVTGGTRGIGASIALAFQKAGTEVTITGTSETSLDMFFSQNPKPGIKGISVDLSKEESTNRFIAEVRKADFDILINNAGINKLNPANEIPLEEWEAVQAVNARAPFLLSQAVHPGMKRKQWGRILNISSVFGIYTKGKRLSYTMSKFSLVGMTKTLAIEFGRDNILVNAISPGFIDTELTRRNLGQKGIEQMLERVPLRRLGKAEDIAHTALFLCSPLTTFITGQNIVVDGGFTCG
jgi:3-oxoacyl-[acyl-carrier protein] reductase